MTNPVRDYAWGSTTRLATFLGRPPSGGPEAELWLGAHGSSPSLLPDGRRLDDAVRDAPEGLLGERVHDAFGERLPFLMKVLAVDQPLSLQVHPSADQAEAGYRREDDAGVALDDGRRCYKDRSHKPELVVALTPFEGLAGFRDPAASATVLRLLEVPWAHETAERLESATLREIVTDTLRLPGDDLEPLLKDVATAAPDAAARADAIDDAAARTLRRIGELVATYPRDPGVLVTLLLNNVLLAPGEAMFVDAGVVHSYFGGFGVEVMATSDNVLRAGLTPKHLDVDELLAVTDFRAVPPPRWEPTVAGPDFCRLEPPVAEFSLTLGRPPLPEVPADGPRVVLVVDGSVTVAAGHERLTLTRGESVFVADADGPVEVTGDGRVAIGAVPR